MLKIVIPPNELWDETTGTFIQIKGCELQLEHSLVSISKWESKWNKSFLTNKQKTNEETMDYIRCMTLTQNVDQNTYKFIPNDVLDQISKYINLPMTAVHFSNDEENNHTHRTITSEVIYAWMIAMNIPFECQKWHLNRLLTLIRVCNIENGTSKKKRTSREIMSKNAALNAARRKQYNSKG